jgi:acetyl/propionyl-CoA carboxylase alpha subunit
VRRGGRSRGQRRGEPRRAARHLQPDLRDADAKTFMLFGDAKKTLEKLVGEVRHLE